MTHWHRFLVGVLFTTVLSVVVLVPAQDVVKVSETHKILLEVGIRLTHQAPIGCGLPSVLPSFGCTIR